MSLFDETQTYEPMDKYAAHTAVSGDSLSLPETIIGGAVATLTDIGTTYWNSLTPERFNASTSDLLSRIDDDALQVYNENPETIKALSFVGGLVAPIGLSIKGMNALRSGTKGYSWFSEAGQKANLTKVEEAFKNSRGAIDESFIKAKWDVYRGVALNAVADNVAAEIAILGALSAHPYMEDYFKDFGSNFVKSVAFGSGIQTGIGSIISKFEISKLTGAVEKQVIGKIKTGLIEPLEEAGITERSHLGELAAVQFQNLENMKAQLTLADKGEIEMVPFVRAHLGDQIQRAEAELVVKMKGATSGELSKFMEVADKETVEHFLKFIGQDNIAGLDKIAFAEVKGITKKGTPGVLEEEASLFQNMMKKLKGGGEKEVTVKTDAIYTPLGGGRFISKADAPFYLQAADLGKTVDDIEKMGIPHKGKLNDSDWAFEIGYKHTAVADAEYQAAVLSLEKMGAKDIEALIVDPEHLPLMKAILARTNELRKTDPALDIKIKLTKAPPSWNAVQLEAISQRSGVADTYLDDLNRLERDWDAYAAYSWKQSQRQGISYSVHEQLHEWVRGHKGELRLGATLYKNLVEDAAKAMKPEVYARASAARSVLEDLYHSAPSRALREQFQKLADAEGYVWLYRGLAGEPDAHRALESYAVSGKKASEFIRNNQTGQVYDKGVKMYRVHVDDIVAGIKDMGPGGSVSKAAPEILAFPPTRDFAQVERSNLRSLPNELTINAPTVKTVGKTTMTISGMQEFEKTLVEAQAKIVTDLQKRGYGIETIALKTGTPIETVEAIIQNGRVEGAGLLKYSSRQDVEVALDYKNRSLALSTDMNKVPQPEMLAALNARNLEASSQGILEQVLLSSRSETVQGFATTVLSPAMKDLSRWIYKEAQNIAPALLKSSMFASTNQVLEALGPLGTYINAFGKEVIAAKNALTETFETPLANLMGAVIKNGEAALIEGNTAIAVQASIKGRKLYKDGAFWIPSDTTSNSMVRQLIAASDDEFKLLTQAAEEAGKPLVVKASYNGNSYDIATQEVRSLMESLQKYGREMYEIKNAKNIALGRGELQDIGFWAPSFNPRDKSVAYVFDNHNKKTSMLFARTDEALAEGIKNYENMLSKKHGWNWGAQFDIVTKDNQEYYNQLAGRHDPLYMDAADLSKQHGGASTPAVVSTDTSVFQELLGGYQTHSQRAIEDVAEIHLDKVMALLKDVSDVSQGIYAKETKGVLSKLSSKPVDAGQTVRNILLGRPLIGEHKAWQEFQQRGQVWTDQAFKTIATAFEPLVGKSVTRSADDWNKVVADMEAKGIVNPFDGLDKEFGLGRYMTEGKGTKEGLTPRAVALGNAAAATIMLRFADLAQPLINAISLPILTAGAINRRMAASFAGEALDPNAKFSVFSAMSDGIRFMNSPMSQDLRKAAAAKGLFSMELRNVSEMLEHQRSLDPGLLTKGEAFLEKFSQAADNKSNLRFFTKAADKSEEMVREVSFFVAANIAKKAYPGIGTDGIIAFARNFMDETIGNYTAAQRPALFQGTFGVAMGLFQTYMLTMAQSMYRNVQYRDWATLGKMLLTQSSIFGAGSLPGFQVVSEQIAKSFSDQNIDLETGTIRAVGDPLANIILYGMPSSFGPGISTRGDLQPRIPNPFQADSIAAVNMTVQSYQALERVVSAAMTADANTGKAMLEALSLQSISRPVARISELFSGQSITSRGDVVDSDVGLGNVDNILSLSTLSRVMATRPLEEIKARQALHHNSLYQSFDAEKRRGVTNQLKSYIRNGNLDSEKLEQLAEQYLRTGSSGGWRMAVQDAIRQAGAGGDATTLAKLKKDSPLMMLVDDFE